jgi:hypothetical protein
VDIHSRPRIRVNVRGQSGPPRRKPSPRIHCTPVTKGPGRSRLCCREQPHGAWAPQHSDSAVTRQGPKDVQHVAVGWPGMLPGPAGPVCSRLCCRQARRSLSGGAGVATIGPAGRAPARGAGRTRTRPGPARPGDTRDPSAPWPAEALLLRGAARARAGRAGSNPPQEEDSEAGAVRRRVIRFWLRISNHIRGAAGCSGGCAPGPALPEGAKRSPG